MSVDADISALRKDFQEHLQRDARTTTQVAVIGQIVERIEDHIKTQNGQVATIKEDQLRQEGAFGMLKWMIGYVLVPLAGIGVVITGIVLGYLVRGG